MLLLVYGTRPEWIKIKPLVDGLKKEKADFKILFTGQHTNLVDGEYDYKIDIGDNNINRLNNIFGNLFLSDDLELITPEYVLVQGDTASVCAIAIKYYNLGSKIIHLEAGLRTYDLNNPAPEEAYRQIVSRFACINLCPTKENANNLKNEKCSGSRYVVGNTVLDNIINIKTNYKNKVLCTFHRRENIEQIKDWFTMLNLLAIVYSDIDFLLPIHPNPNILKYKGILTNVKVIDPLDHDELIDFLKDCKLVITDSGGIQEEASFLQKKTIVCRKTSERMANSGHLILCKSPNELQRLFNENINNFTINESCPYGDGKSVEKIIKILKKLSIIK